MREHKPDKWEILKFSTEKGSWYKVFGTWSGGYLDGDSWRLSSGLKKVTEDGDYYLMKNYSGSIYKCHKEMRGVAGAYNYGALEDLKAQGEEQKVKVEVIGVEEFKKVTQSL